MPNTITLADAQGFRDHAQVISQQLQALAVYGGNTLSRITIHDGVKGKKILTQLLFQKMGRRYSVDFNPPADTVNLKPLTIEVEAAKFEAQIVPQEFEATYLADFKKTKFRNVEDWPFQAYILEKMAMQQNREIVDAIWQGVKAAVPAATDTIDMIFDGFLKRIADGLTSGDLTATAVTGGAYTVDNIIPSFEEQFDALDTAHQSLPISTFVAPHNYNLYLRAYRKHYTSNSEIVRQGVAKLDFVNAHLIACPGMGSSNRVLMTPTANLNVAYDSLNEVTDWNIQPFERKLKYFADFKIGTQFTFLQDGIVSVNDLT